MSDVSGDVLQEQIDYYRARAGEYDEWFLRQGRYDRGQALNRQWFTEAAQVREALTAFGPTGHVLELAGGTGLWTQILAETAATLTVVDASAEMLALNQARLAGRHVDYVLADLWTWRPEAHYDAVFFGFWLSHVPPERFDDFWRLVGFCLAPGGRIFFVDSLPDETSTAVDHRLPGETATLTRRLNDGREFQIVKVFYDPLVLEERLHAIGWQVTVQNTPSYFLYGSGTLSEGLAT